MALGRAEFDTFTPEMVAEAEVLKVLGDSDGKLVEHVRNDQGDFVRRTYQPEAVNHITNPGMSFAASWQAFNVMMANAGIELAESKLMDDTALDNPVILVKFLGNIGLHANREAAPVASRASKIQLAGNLGRLMTSHEVFLPSLQSLFSDAFAVDPDTGAIVLVDVDPFLVGRDRGLLPMHNLMFTEELQADFIGRCGRNFVEWAADNEELAKMAAAFCVTASDVWSDNPSPLMIRNFTNVHFLANGVAPEYLSQIS